jgi:hypothetical protein
MNSKLDAVMESVGGLATDVKELKQLIPDAAVMKSDIKVIKAAVTDQSHQLTITKSASPTLKWPSNSNLRSSSPWASVQPQPSSVLDEQSRLLPEAEIQWPLQSVLLSRAEWLFDISLAEARLTSWHSLSLEVFKDRLLVYTVLLSQFGCASPNLILTTQIFNLTATEPDLFLFLKSVSRVVGYSHRSWYNGYIGLGNPKKLFKCRVDRRV